MIVNKNSLKIIILSFSLIYALYELNNKNYIFFSSSNLFNKNIYREKNYKAEDFNKSINFIDANIRGFLINKEKINLDFQSKISVVIPCFNCKNYIERAVRSIQNQDFQNFEIVIVNDYSTDGSSLYLEELQKEDSRIKFLNNNKNMGTLYTRSIGTLSAKGKYIFPFDSDDMFFDKDILSTIIKIAEKDNIDIVIFDIIKANLTFIFNSTKIEFDLVKFERKPNLIISQPGLGFHPIRPVENNIKVIEMLIYGRCVKANIYQKALNKLGIFKEMEANLSFLKVTFNF